jgi:hypothetical protein
VRLFCSLENWLSPSKSEMIRQFLNYLLFFFFCTVNKMPLFFWDLISVLLNNALTGSNQFAHLSLDKN